MSVLSVNCTRTDMVVFAAEEAGRTDRQDKEVNVGVPDMSVCIRTNAHMCV